jgi:hypothetical protein
MDISIRFKDYSDRLNRSYDFLKGRLGKLIPAESDLSTLKSKHTAEVIRHLRDMVPYYAQVLWTSQRYNLSKIVESIPILKPIPQSLLNEINSRVMSKAEHLPLFEMSPKEDKVIAKICYGVATGAGELTPFLCGEFKTMKIDHIYTTNVAEKKNNNTTVEIRDANNVLSKADMEHSTSAYRRELLGNTFGGMVENNSYYLST